MEGINLAYFITSLAVSLIALGYSIYQCVNLLKDKRQTIIYKDYLKKVIPALIVFSVLFTFAMLSTYFINSYKAKWYEYLQVIFGGLFLSASIGVGIDSFIVHYYKKGLPEKLDKILFYSLIAAIPLSILSLFIMSDGLIGMGGERFLFPKGISFTDGLVRPDELNKTTNIAFYAICILSGALFVYFLCDHKMYLEYGKHGTLDATFLVAFPSGILGARIAYVIGNWKLEHFDTRVANGEWWSIFAIWEGGLTILGGAIAGIIVGVLVYIKTNPDKSIWRAVDIIVPTILLAQAIGRWGNFFNCEVHGGLVNESEWSWLPKIIFTNAHYSSTNKWAEPGFIYAPLFFIEFLVNLLGYFVLAHLFGIKLKKILAPGDLAFGYVIWYGYTRVFMEPLRDASFNMGEDGYWSWFWSLIFVLAGALLIAINHIVRYILKEKKKEEASFSIRSNSILISVLSPLAIGFIISGIITMCNNPSGLSIALNGFNIGVICLVTGVAFLLLDAATITELIFKLKNNKQGQVNA